MVTFLWDVPRSRMCELDCNYDSWFYPIPENDLWCRACNRTCKKHPAISCNPPPKLQRKFDLGNDHWVAIRKKKEPLPIYEEALKILQQEGYPPPLEDPDLITWLPPQNVSNSFSFKTPKPLSSVPLTLEISCMMFTSSSATYGTEFLALERKTNPTTQTHTKPFVQPIEVQRDGKLKPITQAEEVLNWKTENSLAQNGLLTKINQKVDNLKPIVEQS